MMRISISLLLLFCSYWALAQKRVNQHTVFWYKTEINEIFYDGKEEKPRGWSFGEDFVFRGQSTYDAPSPEDGEYYEGYWLDNMRNGEGTMYYVNGKVKYQGSWQKDKFTEKNLKS